MRDDVGWWIHQHPASLGILMLEGTHRRSIRTKNDTTNMRDSSKQTAPESAPWFACWVRSIRHGPIARPGWERWAAPRLCSRSFRAAYRVTLYYAHAHADRHRQSQLSTNSTPMLDFLLRVSLRSFSAAYAHRSGQTWWAGECVHICWHRGEPLELRQSIYRNAALR